MKKITDNIIADFLGIVRQSVYSLKRIKPKQYKAIKKYLTLKENGFFEDFNKIKALSELIKQDCKSKYVNDLIELIKKDDEIIKELENA